MIVVKNERILDVPTLHVVKEEMQDVITPLVIFIHGFGSAKEHNLHYAYLLAEKGVRVLLPDAMLHGERSAQFNEVELSFKFWDIVVNSIQEIEVLKDDLVARHLIDEQKIGLAGISMGGICTLGALTQYPWINTGVSLMGSPVYVEFANYLISQMRSTLDHFPISDEELERKIDTLSMFDLSLQPETLGQRPLMFWHGIKDKVVPYGPTYSFYQSIKAMYKGKEEDLLFLTDEKSGHKVSRNGVLRTVQWFDHYLTKK